MINANDLLPPQIAETEPDPHLNAMEEFEQAAQQLQLEPWIVDRLRNPEREVVLNLSYSLPGCQRGIVTGYRVLQSSARGPGLGPLYIAPDVSLNHVRASALKSTWQCAMFDLPLGGSSGALVCDGEDFSEAELRSIVRAYIAHMGALIGHRSDIIVPQRGCNCKLAAWMMEACGRPDGLADFATVTGKPSALLGLASQDLAAQGLLYLLEAILADRGGRTKHQSVVIQGFGATGAALASTLHDAGAQIVGLADISGALYREHGMDVHQVETYFRRQRMLYGYPDADAVCNADLLEAPADILILAAAANQITTTNAERVRAGIVMEMAECAVSSAGHEILNQRGILVVPELLANAGAIIAAFLEWTQGMRLGRLSAEELQQELKSRLVKSWRQLGQFPHAGAVDLRRRALQLGVSRVAETLRLLG